MGSFRREDALRPFAIAHGARRSYDGLVKARLTPVGQAMTKGLDLRTFEGCEMRALLHLARSWDPEIFSTRNRDEEHLGEWCWY